MAIQISIDGRGGEEHGIGHAATSWVVAFVDGLGRALVWIFESLQSVRGREAKQKHMQLVESLALGNRRQLLLVVCGEQRYLVGAGADNVGSILALEPGTSLAIGMAPAAGTASGSTGRARKGPELVRHKGGHSASGPDQEAGAW